MVIIKKQTKKKREEKSTSKKSFRMQTVEKKRETSLPRDRYTFSKQRKLFSSISVEFF